MMCSECRQLAPRTFAQLDNRLKNIALSGPNISIHPCQKCGGVEYMTTDVMIKNVLPPLKYRWQLNYVMLIRESRSLGYLLIVLAIVMGTVWFINH